MAKALTGFLQHKSAEGLAPVTVYGYERDLGLWIEYQGDMDLQEICSQHVLTYLSYLRTEYVPRRIDGDNSRKLTPKTVYNIYISLASFFTWAGRDGTDQIVDLEISPGAETGVCRSTRADTENCRLRGIWES